MSSTIDPLTHRHAEHPIEPLILQRWSPRAMSGEPLSRAELMRLFEAARWAPSTYNEQEWRFVYGLRDTPAWPALFELLAEPNKLWCARAAMLVCILGHKVFARNQKPNPVHLFDCGSAFENLALQGTAMGLVVHGMSGFDYEKAPAALGVPADYAVVAMFAVGRPGKLDDLAADFRPAEMPSGRRPIEELIFEGKFTA